jgi:hypothetical protein
MDILWMGLLCLLWVGMAAAVVGLVRLTHRSGGRPQ